MEDLSILEELLKLRDLTLKTRTFLEDIKGRFNKFGSLTDSQKNIINNIAREHGLIKQEKVRTLAIVQPNEFKVTEIKSVLNDESRKEIFQFMRDCVNGKHNKNNVNQYCELISDLLKNKGIKVENYD